MPRVNGDKHKEAASFSPLPDGKYICEVVNVNHARTRNDDDMFKLEFEIVIGDYKGRKLYDNIVFSDRAMPRAILILKRMGFVMEGEVDIKAEDVRGRRVVVVCEGTESYETRDGDSRTKNIIPFDGYERVAEDFKTDDDEELPF